MRWESKSILVLVMIPSIILGFISSTNFAFPGQHSGPPISGSICDVESVQSKIHPLPPASPEYQAAVWNTTYGDTGDDSAGDIIEVSTGGFAILGRTDNMHSPDQEVWLIRTDATGNHLWNQTYGGIEHDTGVSLIECSDGGFAFVGVTFSWGAGENEGWLVRTDATGNHLWNQTYGGSTCDLLWDLVECNDGGFALIGSTKHFGATNFDMWLIRTDASGNYLWSKTYGSVSHDHGKSILKTATGFLLFGELFTSQLSEFYVVETDQDGNELWSQVYGGPGIEQASQVTPVSEGGFILLGRSESFSTEFQMWVIRIDTDGSQLWNYTYGAPYTLSKSLVECADGGFALSGSYLSPPHFANCSDGVVFRIDGDGHLIWSYSYGKPTIIDSFDCMLIDSAGYLITVGSTHSYGAGESDAWLLCIPAPQWATTNPSYTAVEMGAPTTVNLNATSPLGLDSWWLNDTAHFTIDSDGIIRNSTNLPFVEFPIQIWVNDTFGRTITTELTIQWMSPSPPTWVSAPINHVLDINHAFSYDLDASDMSGIDTWWLNDTTHFGIDSQGLVTNSTFLSARVYGIQVWVNDTIGYTLSGTFTVTVQDSAPPTWMTPPVDQILAYNVAFNYQLQASDLSGLDTWWIDDTVHFTVTQSGIIRNATFLENGSYQIHIWVNDTLGNTLTDTFYLIIQAPTSPTTTPLPGIPGFPLESIVLGLVTVLIPVVIYRRRQSKEGSKTRN